MTITQQVAEIAPLLEKNVKTPAEKTALAGKLMGLVAHTQSDGEVPTAVFEALGAEGRQLALSGLAFILLQVLQEE